MLTAVNYLSLQAADLRLLPPTFPATNRVRVQLRGLAASQRVQLEAIPRLGGAMDTFTPVILGAPGESVFEIPIPWSEEGYFRAVAFDSVSTTPSIDLRISTELQRFTAGEPFRLAAEGALIASGSPSLNNAVLEVMPLIPSARAGLLLLRTSNRLQVGSNATVRLDGIDIATQVTSGVRLQLRFNHAATPAAVTELMRRIEYTAPIGGPDRGTHVLRWDFRTGIREEVPPKLQTLQLNEICHSPMDVVLVLDRTSSIAASDFELLRQATHRFLDELGLSAVQRRAAVVSFCSSGYTHVPLTSELSSLHAAVAGLQQSEQLGGVICDGTSVATGIREALHVLDDASRLGLVLLMTDGWENGTASTEDALRELTISAATEAHQRGSRLLVYALGAKPDMTHLQHIVANPADLISASNYLDLPNNLSLAAKSLCNGISPLPRVFAGEDLRIALREEAQLAGLCSGCSAQAHIRWEVVSGPGAVGFRAQQLASRATFSEPGSYRLRLTISEGPFRSSDELEVQVYASNQPPIVEVNVEQRSATEVLLIGQGADDGIDVNGLRSPEPLRAEWTLVSGPGQVAFERSNALSTFASCSQPGHYVFKLEVRDAGGLSDHQLIQVQIRDWSPWEYFPAVGYTSTAIGGLRDLGEGKLHLTGVHGRIRRAYLYWHGPVDSERPDANARVRFQGRWMQGDSLGISHDDGWTYERNHPYAVAHAYRADVTALVDGDGVYEVSGLLKTPQLNVNGASLIVMFEEPDPDRRHDVHLWSGNESNGQYAPAANDQVYALAPQPNGGVVMGGVFTQVGGISRNRVARLLASGQVDLRFDPGTGPDGIVRSLALEPDGTIWVGGSFSQWSGQARGGLVRLRPDGSLLQPYGQDLSGGEVYDLLLAHGNLWAAGSGGLRQLSADGGMISSYRPRAIVRTIRMAADGTLWFGGDQLGEAGTRTGWIGRLARDQSLEEIACEVDGSVLAMAELPEGGWYVGGTFSHWNRAKRHGIARIDRDGRLDADWVPDALNQIENQEVRSLIIQEPALELPWSEPMLIAGGRIQLPTEIGETRVALCRFIEGSVDSEYFELLIRNSDGDRVNTLAVEPETGNLWVGGEFAKGAQRNRVLLDQGGHLLTENPGDRGWNVALETGPDPLSTIVELHVSDGQPCFACLGEWGGEYLDPELLINDEVWQSPFSQNHCDAEQTQLFAGASAPSAGTEDCRKGRGLWDVIRFPLDGIQWSEATAIMTSRYSGAAGQEDLVSLVAVAVLSPPSSNSPNRVAFHGALVRDDHYELNRSGSNQRLLVLANDLVPAEAKILEVSQPSPVLGLLRVAPDASSLVFEPHLGSNGQISDTFSYVVGWDGHAVATGHVAVVLSGPAPGLLPEQGTLAPSKLTSGPSFLRGPRHFSQTFVHEAKGIQRLDLSVLDPEFAAHLYVRDPDGDLVSAAWHESDPFGSFSPRITPVHLSCELGKPGRYTIEVAGNQPEEGGRYDLQVGHEWPDGPLVRLRVNQVEVADRFPIGWVPPPEGVIDIEWDNLSGKPLADFRCDVFSTNPSIELSLSEPAAQEVVAGGTARWACRVSRALTTPGGSAELIFRAWVEGRPIYRSVGLIHFGPGAPGIQVQAHPISGRIYELEMIPLTSSAPDHTTFVVDTDSHRALLPSEGRTVLWSNASPGLHFVWAYTDATASVPVPLRIPPELTSAEAVPDLFHVDANSAAVPLNVLHNDHDLVRVVSVTEPSLGSIRILSDALLEYIPKPDTTGQDHFEYSAVNARGDEVTAEIRVEIADPVVRWLEPATDFRYAVGRPIPIRIQIDNTGGSPLQTRFWVNNQRIPSSEGVALEASWIPMHAGVATFVVEFLDDLGQWRKSSPRQISIGDAPGSSISLAITQPVDGQWVEEDRLQIRGTFIGNRPDSRFRLVLQRSDGSVLQEHVGVGAILEGILGEFDLSLLPNGPYDLTLSTEPGVGGEIQETVSFVLQSRAKIGQLLFTETDIEVPSEGLPLILSRTYDSFNPKGGDFGPGWTLSLYDLQVEINEQRDVWIDPETEDPFEVRVGGRRDLTVTLPGGARTTFRHQLTPGPTDGGIPCFCYEANWVAPPGVSATLTAMGNRELRFIPFQQEMPPFWTDAGPGTPWENYDFRGWNLTNTDGSVMEIGRPWVGSVPLETASVLPRSVEVYGAPTLRSIKLPSGERVEVSNGETIRIDQVNALNRRIRSLILKRGFRGFITEAFDTSAVLSSGDLQPGALPLMRYEYDPANGQLIAVRRLQDPKTGRYSVRSYSYGVPHFPHYLTEVKDERGVIALRTEYDTEGRLTTLLDSMGQGTSIRHDRARRREESTDALGNRTIHEYDPQGNVVKSVDPGGRITLRKFGQNHQLLAETNAWGTANETWKVFDYDHFGNLNMQASALGTNWFVFDERGRLKFHQDPIGIQTTNQYDSVGRLVSSRRSAGMIQHETQHRYDDAGLLAESTDSAGLVTRYYHDSLGQLTNRVVVGPDGSLLGLTSMTYDARGNKVSESNLRHGLDGAPEIATSFMDYDLRNRLIRTRDPLGGIRELDYDSVGHQVASRDELGRVTRYFYDRRGQLIQTVYPSDSRTPRAVSRTIYDALSRPIFIQQTTALPESEVETNSVVVASGQYRSYDELGRLVRSGQCRELAIRIAPDSEGTLFAELVQSPELLSSTETTYDAAGRIAWTRDPMGVVTAYEYDQAGRRTAITNAWNTPRQMIERSIYSDSGLLVSSVDGAGQRTDYSLDEFGRRIATWPPEVDGQRSSLWVAYDLAGRQVFATNELGLITAYGYDSFGRLTSVTNALGSESQIVTRYGFDEAGNQTSQTDALGRVTRYAYDALGRRVMRELPGGEREFYRYDAVGNLTDRTNFNGRVIHQYFDARDRLWKRTERLADSEEVLAEFTYTATGRRATQWDASGPTTYAYDDWDRLKVRDKPGWGRLEYGYSADGRVATTDVDTGEKWWQLRYRYDELGRMIEASIPTLGIGAVYSYDASGLLSETRYANGVTNAFRYDSRHRLRQLLWGGDGQEYARFDYQVNEIGQRTRLDESFRGAENTARTYLWRYDDLQRLTQESISGLGSASYVYDLVGNRLRRDSSLPGILSTQAHYDQNDRMDPDEDPLNANPDYDANGNTLRGEYQGRAYEDRYDAENRLIERKYLAE